MKYFLTTLLIGFISLGFSQPPGYLFGKQITIDATKVSGSVALTNFPVLISITDPDLRTTSNGGSVANVNGYDIIFGLGDCATIVSHDLEYYNPVTGELVVWVQVPVLDNSVNTSFFMFYGNGSVSTNQSTSNIWTDVGYDGVWHLHNDFIDASGSGNNGVNHGSTDLSPAYNSADGQSFVDPNNWIELPNHPTRVGDFSYSGWARTLDNTRPGQRVICDDANNGPGGHAISIGDPGTGKIRLYIRGMSPTIVDSPTAIIANDTWYYVSATFNGTTKLGSLYVNGVLINSATYSGTLGSAPGNASIGGEIATGETLNRFQGDLDEIRANNSLLSADWFATEYNNQNSPNTFYSFSTQLDVTTLCQTLPIKLLNFSAILTNNNSVKLEWQTASEINNDFFTIERSKNGIEWEEIGRVEGAGNSSSLLYYSSIDNYPYYGVSYYRLKQTDFDGQFKYSFVQSVKLENSPDTSVEIYPNPTNNKLTIIGNITELEQVKIFNNLGQDVTKFVAITGDKIQNSMIFDMSELSTGIYVVKTKTNAYKIYKH